MKYTYEIIKDIDRIDDYNLNIFGNSCAEYIYDSFIYKKLRKCIIEDFEFELDLTGVGFITSDFIRILCSLIVLEFKKTQVINIHIKRLDDDREQILNNFKYYFDLSMKKFKVKK